MATVTIYIDLEEEYLNSLQNIDGEKYAIVLPKWKHLSKVLSEDGFTFAKTKDGTKYITTYKEIIDPFKLDTGMIFFDTSDYNDYVRYFTGVDDFMDFCRKNIGLTATITGHLSMDKNCHFFENIGKAKLIKRT